MCDIFVRQLTKGTAKELSKMDILMNEEQQETGDYVVDEKDKNANLTEEGVRKAERFFQVENLADPDNLELQHNINLALRAHSLMHRDKDYVVKDDEVLIVDEFTGRIMPGRRFRMVCTRRSRRKSMLRSRERVKHWQRSRSRTSLINTRRNPV